MAVIRLHDEDWRGFRARTVRPRGAEGLMLVPAAEWRALRRYRPNILIEGSESDTENTLVALAADFGSRVLAFAERQPERPTSAGTLVVRDLAAFGPAAQDELLQRMQGGEGRLQVIATSRLPVYELMCQGLFRADLYYRLNAIRLVVERGGVSLS